MSKLGDLEEAKARVEKLDSTKILNDLAETFKDEERKMIEANTISYEDYTRPVTI